MTPEQRAAWLAGRTKHGAYSGGKESSEHAIWRGMLARCSNPNNASYKYYGGRGITVCKRWLEFENFYADMGSRPDGLSLDRKNNARGYSSSNCVWATRSAQQKNKTTTKRYTNGVFTGVLVECAAHLGISKELAHIRWKAWGSFEKEVIWQQKKVS